MAGKGLEPTHCGSSLSCPLHNAAWCLRKYFKAAEGVSPAGVCGKSIPDKRNSQDTGPEAGAYLGYLATLARQMVWRAGGGHSGYIHGA